MYLSQSRAPKSRPRKTPEEVKAVICELRESLSEQYHRPAGASLIHRYLQKHKVALDGKFFVPQSSRTITQILRERGYILPPRKREHIPLPLSAPMEEWEMDFCEIRLEDGKFEFFLVVDRGTSRVVYLEGCPGYRSDSALQAVFRLFLLNGLLKRLRLDRDPRFVWSWSADGFPAPLVRMLHGQVFRRRIRTNGSIQIDKHLYYVDTKLTKHTVPVHLDAHKGCFCVSVDGKALLKILPIKDLLEELLPIQDYLAHLQQEATSIARYREMRWMQSGEAA